MTTTHKILLAVAVAFLAAQAVPVSRSNPGVEENIAAPSEVERLLRRSCYDCHSNETSWPWYAYVAPTSLWLAHHVEHGREHLNFSTWNQYDDDDRLELIEEAWEEVEDEHMPPWYYLMVHPSARLDPQDQALLREWARSVNPDH